jgi:hypothetical protein
MSNEVYANGREIACKAGAGKTICATPDVCFTPPENPATPPGVPVPYPNTGFASDTDEGSKNVMISGKEIMLKNNSCFKKSTGDEAGCAAKKGVITSKNTGKVYFNAWSMDVKFEGENVDRHLDLTTNNHASLPGDTPPWPFTDSMTVDQLKNCEEDKKKEEEACSEDGISRGKETKYKSVEECCDEDKGGKCQEARKCMLVPYKHKSKTTCCPGQSGHHLIEDHGLCNPRGVPLPEFSSTDYHVNAAPCVCAKSPNSNWEAEHGDLHCVQGIKENYAIKIAGSRQPPRSEEYAWNYGEAKQAGVDAHAATFKGGCNEACIAAQLDNYYKDKLGLSDSTPLRTTEYGFGNTLVNQLARGVQLIKELAEKRIGQIVGGPFPLG